MYLFDPGNRRTSKIKANLKSKILVAENIGQRRTSNILYHPIIINIEIFLNKCQSLFDTL